MLTTIDIDLLGSLSQAMEKLMETSLALQEMVIRWYGESVDLRTNDKNPQELALFAAALTNAGLIFNVHNESISNVNATHWHVTNLDP